MVKIIGISGGIACGKSALTKCLKEENIPVVDADAITHDFYRDKRGAFHKAILDIFGDDVLDDEGFLDRTKIGPIARSDEAKMRLLNKATHPLVQKEITRQVLSLMWRGYRRIALDIPLLARKQFDLPRRLCLSVFVAVVVNPEVQVARLVKRDGCSEEEAQAKIKQWGSMEELLNKVGVIIENNGTEEELKNQVRNKVVNVYAPGWSAYEVLASILVVPCCFAGVVKYAFSAL